VPGRTVRDMSECERCAEFARELAAIDQQVGVHETAELSGAVPSGSTRPKLRLAVVWGIARCATSVLSFVRAMPARSNRGRRRVVSGEDYL
jgi:hypothetical protein